ncbi:PREDICTED: putative aminopeptidase W07G4.4 [Acropora digitifera]|uniref:putative aminopeptidase W07G4.4 n=1 Tax=Acropora digitifera TaxID=70779 RepID=UPI00077A6524|nr:PREDICTED: putative aminopeptidase W07G4.4 [Acropora digitifera]
MSLINGLRQSCAVVPVSSPSQEGFDCFVLVCENLEWDNPTWEFLKEPIKAAAKVDKAVGVDTLLFPCKETSMVYSPTGPVNRDYDDVRRFGDAASKGIKRALKAGSESPLLVTIPGKTFPNSWSVSLLGALNELYLPLELRDAFPEKQQKVKQLGVMVLDQSQNLDFVTAIESGRCVCRDIGGSDPERMSAPRVEEYITKLFGDSSPVKVSVVKDVKEFEAKYPLYEAVNRCSRAVERHAGRVIHLEYVGEGEITKTILLVGKGVTYDTGGADVKAGGIMAGMSRDKCGAAAVAGFFQVFLSYLPIQDKKKSSNRVYLIMHGSILCYHLPGHTPGDLPVFGGLSPPLPPRYTVRDNEVIVGVLALKEKVPAHIVTIATLTGHAILAMGPYSIVLDNGPAAQTKFAQTVQEAGHVMGDPFEISTLRREDYEFTNEKSEYADVLQCNNAPSRRTPRGHQFPAAFLIRASGLDKHGIDSEHPIRYSHFDIAGSCDDFPYAPTGAPLVAMATHFLKGHC